MPTACVLSRASTLLLAGVLASAACATPAEPVPAAQPDLAPSGYDADAAHVYAAVIVSAFAPEHGQRLYVEAELRSSRYLPEPHDHELWPALQQARQSSATMPETLPLILPHRVLSAEAIAAAFEPQGWNSFYRGYPDAAGLMEFTAVGFDPTHRRALVGAGIGQGGHRGWGAYFLLEKRDGIWRVVERFKEYIV